jgi:hypothetical protein
MAALTLHEREIVLGGSHSRGCCDCGSEQLWQLGAASTKYAEVLEVLSRAVGFLTGKDTVLTPQEELIAKNIPVDIVTAWGGGEVMQVQSLTPF